MDNKRTYEYLNYIRDNFPNLSDFHYRAKLQSISNDFARTHCTNPSLVSGVDYYTGSASFNYYSCGKCDHCRNVKSNELLSRIFLDLPLQGYLYFVTLTYTSVYFRDGSFYGYKDIGSRERMNYVQYPLSSRVMHLLSKNCLHIDRFNTRGRACYSTCLLDMDDFSGFMKRLRKSTPGVLYQFCCFGEYGHKYGHPHMHALISSNKPVDLSTFRNAWSVYGCSIGNCYVDDISASGSVHATVKYVTKYVSKKDDFNDVRVRFAYDGKYNINGMSWGSPQFIIPGIIEAIYNNSLNLLYDYETGYLSDPQDYFSKFETTFDEFRRQACQRPRYSSRYCFGSLYYAANSSRFLSGNERLPKSNCFSLSFPSYFRRKIRRQKYPLGIYKKSLLGSHYFVASSVPAVASAFKKFLSPVLSNPYLPLHKSTATVRSLVDRLCVDVCLFHKFDTNEHLIYRNCQFVGLRYSRKSRQYEETGNYYTMTYLYKLYIAQVIQQYHDDIDVRENKEYCNKLYGVLLKEMSDYFVESRALERTLWDNLRSKSKSKVMQSNFNTL